MQTKVVLSTFLGICVIACYAGVLEDGEENLSWNEFAELLSEMTENEKYEFVKEHVLKGYELSQQDVEYEDLVDADLKLSLAVYNIVKEMSDNIEQDKIRLQRNSEICFQPPIGCIDSGDAGVRPS